MQKNILTILLIGVLQNLLNFGTPLTQAQNRNHFTSPSEIDSIIQDTTFKELYSRHNYKGIIDKYCYLSARGESKDECLGWVAQSIYNLGEILANKRDVVMQEEIIYLDDAGASDPIGYTLWRMSVNIGPNIWTKEFVDQYKDLLSVVIKRLRKNFPDSPSYFAFEVNILILTGNYKKAKKLLLTQKKNVLNINQPFAEYLAQFAIRFLAYGYALEAAQLIHDLNNKYGLPEATMTYWREMILRYLQSNDNMELRNKDAMVKRIQKILK